MSVVTIPDDLAAKLRVVEQDEQGDLSELVARVLAKYLTRADPAELIRRVEEREAAIRRAGITEEELADHFEQWRRRQPPDG